jgi:Ser/Thr protein kinase RdoA (MazF antagonist)
VLPDEVIPALLRAGIVVAEEAVAKGVLAEPIGLSHPVWRVSVGGVPRAVLKAFGPSRGGTDGEAAREAAVLALAADRPAVAALVPRQLEWAGAGTVIATAVAPGVPALREGLPEDQWPGLVAALAAPLAAFHRATRDLAAPDALPHPVLEGPPHWSLRLFDGDAPRELWAARPLSEIMAAAAAPETVAALRRARGAWRRLCLVHADLKQDNVLLDEASTPPHATVVDWEMARIGDPAWDLAGPLSRLLLAAGEVPWTETTEAALRRWVAAYAEAARLPAPALAQRTVLYAGAWLLMSALTQASLHPPGQAFEAVRPVLVAAANAFATADAVTARAVAALA